MALYVLLSAISRRPDTREWCTGPDDSTCKVNISILMCITKKSIDNYFILAVARDYVHLKEIAKNIAYVTR